MGLFSSCYPAQSQYPSQIISIEAVPENNRRRIRLNEDDSSTSVFLNRMFEVFRYKLDPLMTNMLENKSLTIKGYQLTFKDVDLSNAKFDFEHVSCVQIVERRESMSRVSPPPEKKDNDDFLKESVATLKVSITVSGASLAIVHSLGEVTIDSVDIYASFIVNVDPTQKVIRIAFLEKPKITTTLHAKCVKDIPKYLVNGDWTKEYIADYIFKKYTVDNPKKINF